MSDLDDMEDFIHSKPYGRIIRPKPPRRRVGDRELRTHCKNGHEFTDENTATVKGRSGRVCKTCHRETSKLFQRQKCK